MVVSRSGGVGPVSTDAPELLVIYGPTATGKTRASIALAKRLRGEVISADSVQVYRGFDIGSAKPTLEEREGVPHHLIDIVNPDEELDAQRFAQLADQAIKEIRERGHIPIIAGGTGLWIRALLRGLVELPPVDATIRAEQEKRVQQWGPEQSHRHLERVDPLTAAAVHPNDSLRIVRALEVLQQVGRPLGELRREHALGAPRYAAQTFVLTLERSLHDRRIERRIQTMLESGWRDEVSRLHAQWGGDVRAFGSVGYREVLAAYRRELDEADLVSSIRKSTRIYARRQRTWASSMSDVTATLELDDLLGEPGEPLLLAGNHAP
jgi:tRNA dimethylallyltransferase